MINAGLFVVWCIILCTFVWRGEQKRSSGVQTAVATATLLALVVITLLTSCAPPAALPTSKTSEKAILRDMSEEAMQAAWETDHCDRSLTTAQCHALGDLRMAALRHSRAELDAAVAKNRWCFEMLMDGRLGDEQRQEIQRECEPKLPPKPLPPK